MSNKNILVIDDEMEIRDLIGICLEGEGFVVFEAANGKVALKILEKHQMDLVILDIMMPKMDGIETCINIRKTKNMPIIMVSAKNEDMDKIIGLTTGMCLLAYLRYQREI